MWKRVSVCIAHSMLACLIAAGGVVRSAAAAAVDSTFTYQGALSEGGTVAGGPYDFTFALFDQLAAGSQVGSTQSFEDVTVTDGTFTVELDFGAGAFPGDERYLEIAVRTGGSSGAYTQLSPRQRLTAVPHAQYAIAAGAVPWTGVSSVPADLVDGDQDTTYSVAEGLVQAGTVLSASFGGTGAATTVARSDHDHDARYFTESELSTSGGGGWVHWDNLTSVPADLADGDDDTTYTASSGLSLNGTAFSVSFAGSGSATTASRSDHDHDTAYVNTSGSDSMSGTLTLAAVAYSTPRSHFASVGSMTFFPGLNTIPYSNLAGAYVAQAQDSNALVAPIQLPDGATVTRFDAHIRDNSSQIIQAGLFWIDMTTGSTGNMALVDSTGASGYKTLSTSTIGFPTVDNSVRGYYVQANPLSPSTWTGDNDLLIMGASVTFAVSQAP